MLDSAMNGRFYLFSADAAFSNLGGAVVSNGAERTLKAVAANFAGSEGLDRFELTIDDEGYGVSYAGELNFDHHSQSYYGLLREYEKNTIGRTFSLQGNIRKNGSSQNYLSGDFKLFDVGTQNEEDAAYLLHYM
jgi:hypothetical protein